MEFDLDKALEDVPIHVEDPPLPPTPSHPWDRMSSYYADLPPPPASPDTGSVYLDELPPVEHMTLESQTKLRPKPQKRTKPSRQPVGSRQRLHVLAPSFCRYMLQVRDSLLLLLY